MHPPSSAAMRVRSTTAYSSSPAKTPRRSSSSEGLQRRVLDLYAKQRRLPAFSLFRMPARIALLFLLLTAIIYSWSLGRHGVVVGLRTISRISGKMAAAMDGRGSQYALAVRENQNLKGGIIQGGEKVPRNRVSRQSRSRRRRHNSARTPSLKVGHIDDLKEGLSALSSSLASNESARNTIANHVDLHSETMVPPSLEYVTPRSVPDGHVSLTSPLQEPNECGVWRRIARNLSAVHPYRKHFTSLDVVDWFLFVAVFDEHFHKKAANRHRRPRYLDVAANHARRWSATWFFDRCMGWDGICAEANPKYFAELTSQRHCHLIPTCVSDIPRTVKFSMTDAYGGVVKDDSQRFGVDGHMHSHLEKFKGEFRGFRELKCTTLEAELSKLQMQRFDFMSLDVEGHELPILQGVDWPKTLIDIIVTENRTPEVQSLLEKVGYTVYKNVLKDFLYIRNDSGYTIDDEWVRAMKALDRRSYLFRTSE